MPHKAKHDADTIKVVINRCFGGFGLSYDALIELYEMGSHIIEEELIVEAYKDKAYLARILERLIPYKEGYLVDNSLSFMVVTNTTDNKKVVSLISSSDKNIRCHPDLIKVVSGLGDKANGLCAKLAIVEIPKDVEWEIDDYDGMEHIAETHRTWA